MTWSLSIMLNDNAVISDIIIYEYLTFLVGVELGEVIRPQ